MDSQVILCRLIETAMLGNPGPYHEDPYNLCVLAETLNCKFFIWHEALDGNLNNHQNCALLKTPSEVVVAYITPTTVEVCHRPKTHKPFDEPDLVIFDAADPAFFYKVKAQLYHELVFNRP